MDGFSALSLRQTQEAAKGQEVDDKMETFTEGNSIDCNNIIE